MTKQNPWETGLLRFGLLCAMLGALFIIGVLVVVALGVQLSETPVPGSRWIALAMLALIAGGAFVIAMSVRWDRQHNSVNRP